MTTHDRHPRITAALYYALATIAAMFGGWIMTTWRTP
jgi:hypothetical protein